MIDVIIPAYNGHDFLKVALDSILIQTISDKLMVTIVNDGSDKDYHDFIETYKDKLDIQELTLKKNHGAGYARQYGINNTHNPFVCFIDCDDYYYSPKSLEILYNEFKQNPKLKRVYGNVEYNGEKNSSLVYLASKMFKREVIEKYNISFSNTYLAEDLGFNLFAELVLKPEEDLYINKIIYYYNYEFNENSITKLDYTLLTRIKCLNKVLENAIKFIKKNKLNDQKNKTVIKIWLIIHSEYVNYKFQNSDEIEKCNRLCHKIYQKYKIIIDYDQTTKHHSLEYDNWLKKVIF